MNSRNKALINYYVRLIQKKTYTLEDVPEGVRSYVKQVLDAAQAVDAAKAEDSKEV